MSKLINYTILSVLQLSLLGCNNEIVLHKTDSNKPVVVRMNKKIQKLNGIYFPFNLTIENTTFSGKLFGKIIYVYSFRAKGAGVVLYNEDTEISNYKPKIVPRNSSQRYQVYSRHMFDTTRLINEDLKPYLEKMIELNQDTLHIGTVAEFKKNHAELFKMLTENDTISIRYLKNENSGLGERIARLANW